MSIFQPGELGSLALANRIVMAPLGRARSDVRSRSPLPRVATYYSQRASAGLIVSEATHVSPNSVSRPGGSAIHSAEQVEGWKAVTAAVHAAGGRIFQQLFHLGRKAHPACLPGNALPIAPSAIAAKGEAETPEGVKPFPVPRAVERAEIPALVEEFRQAARNALLAGFDGVEIHAANGYLVDQFLRDGSNRRRDDYGGSVPNRARFLLEIVDALIGVFGPGRIGVRISPHFTLDGIGDSDPAALYAHVAEQLQARGIAYLHLIEPDSIEPARRLAPRLRQLFRGALILAGEFDRASAIRALGQGRADFVAFGRLFIANPDLVERLRREAPLNTPGEATFYSGGDHGYINYPFLAAH
ncbi:N-ethylmaleimide reductase [Azotobacter beijerinckii]|uniref:N-ethylmaleimide reductase n=1 Tax=Azotobacter beijerinckii TaxID=170623 RepID=A0A1H6Z6W3_9GAMM|nr:alkene reductase [Azotobacter beijerinckii]SEJ49303.1 N-ethylmaleimide reductase [Azotobacter beijerinckii]